MQITYGALTLCDGADRTSGKYTGPRNLRIGDTRTIQVSPVIGAAAPRIDARGNRAVSIAFEVERLHADVATAQAHILALYATIVGQADLTLGTTKFDDAALESAEHWHSGVRTYHRYQFIAGKAL
jgi:hypothetical protein